MKASYLFIAFILFATKGVAKNKIEVFTETHNLTIIADDSKLKVHRLKVVNFSTGKTSVFKPSYKEGFRYSNGKLTEYEIYTLKDINADGVKDIVIPRNYSDYHLNSNYFCWVSDTISDRFVFIEGFEQIAQLNFNSLGDEVLTEYTDCKTRNFTKSSNTYRIENHKVIRVSHELTKKVNEDHEKWKFETPTLADGYGIYKLELTHYNYTFLIDTNNNELYKSSFLLVHNKKNEKLLGIDLRMVNVYYDNWIIRSEMDRLRDLIKEKDINADGVSDLVIRGSNWPSSVSVWVLDRSKNSFKEVPKFFDPANIQVADGRLTYMISIPCGTGMPNREFHTFGINGTTFNLEKILISSYHRKGKKEEEIYRIDKEVRLINGRFEIVGIIEMRDYEEEEYNK